jgi:tetratricopeptide (TPR) repeat protein
MKPENNEVWDSILQGLPPTPSQKDAVPVPEILRVIQFCLKDGVEHYAAATDLADLLSKLRNDTQFLNWKAMVEYEAKDYYKSFLSSQKVLEHIQTAETYFNAGRAAYKANELQLSKEYFEKSLELKGESSTLLDYAVTICSMGDFDKAFDIIESIDKSKLDELHSKVVDFNKGWHYIRRGEFKKGIDLIHLGREINVWGSDAQKYKKPRWDGTTQPGKTILIVGEGGIGDEVINARFSKTIKERGMKAIMSTVHRNASMLSSVVTLDKVIDNKLIAATAWDFWVPCMDLPYILDIDSTDIPSEPYLDVSQIAVNRWKEKLQTNKKLKVGIRWMGNPRYELELGRTIPLENFEFLTDLDIQMYSLQKNDGNKHFKLPKSVIDISDELETWEDTMAAMKNMDLIISSCTSVPHVAGALGVSTWIVIPLLPYYTWADMKKESCWYDSVSLYRQQQWKDWSHPFDEVRRDLKKLLETT